MENPAHAPSASRGLALLLAIGGALGLAAAITLTLDKLALLKDPDYVPSCDFGAVLSCSSIMKTWQAELFGFPNPLLGIAGFSVVVTVGVVLLAGARLPEWFWAGLQAGVTGGVVFVHWLMYQSFFVIKFLCPWCMLVWAVTIPVFWYVTLRNLGAWTPRSPLVRILRDWHALVLSLWLLAVLVGVLLRYFA